MKNRRGSSGPELNGNEHHEEIILLKSLYLNQDGLFDNSLKDRISRTLIVNLYGTHLQKGSQFNFGGASNSIPIGAGGVFRVHQGDIIEVFHSFLGLQTIKLRWKL